YGGYIFVGESDYVSTGTMYVFTKDGKLYDKFDTGGLNPHGATFIYELQ
ncbi:MAG: hypothetical protein HUJ90_04365, partial [Bacteroidales bacterium]|nr:hypothetical protein [Bacteroidales bacterium]